STTNASSCTASGGWSGSKPVNGSQTITALSSTTAFSLSCTGVGGSVARSATVVVSAATGSVFPVHVENGRRQLIDASGKPFLLHGDTPWLLITEVTLENAGIYLEDRRQKGFNAVMVELIEHYYSSNPPKNIYGDAPFLVSGDFSTPNDAYFDHAEAVVALARDKGMLVLLTPAYLGFGGGNLGWYDEVEANSTAKLRGYGQYIANRFRQYDNVLWVEGGDYNAPTLTGVSAIVDGIRDIDATKLHTYHGSRGTSALEWVGTSSGWLNLNNIYTNKDTVIAEAQIEYNRSTLPFFLVEGAYEDESANSQQTRAQAWQTMLSGGTGHLVGQKSVWKFDPIWPTRLNTEGVSTLTHLRSLLESRAWWTLEPDFSNSFLTAGFGSAGTRAPAARAADGRFAIIYVPDVRDITVNIGLLTGNQVQARWYDPTKGTFTTVSGSPFIRSGTRVFRPTGSNSLGKADWVLVLDSL
ncbi:MAG: DUF4038 domain-containing protein, partial [Gammaproteobacteria bacterium]